MGYGIFFIGVVLIGTTIGNTIISSPNSTNWGDWGAWQRCPFGKYVQGMQVKSEPYQGAFADDSAQTGLRLFCGDPSNGTTSYITSTESSWGNWGNVFTCRSDGLPFPPDGFVVGFQLRVEAPVSLGGDDTATNNIRVTCYYPSFGGGTVQVKEGDGLTYGSWTTEQNCDRTNQRVCALRTQVEAYFSGDNTSVNNISVECCDI